MLTESTKRPFVAEVILLHSLISNKLFIAFVDGVVSEVHVFILFVDLLCVSFRSKAGQPFLMNVHSQRLIACNTDVDTQVKLMSIYQQRVSNVLADDRSLINIDIVNVIYQVNSFALA